MAFGKISFEDFRKAFEHLEELEVALMILYFKKANDAVMADDQIGELSAKERHLAYCYVLLEMIGDDEVFVGQFLHDKKKDGSYIKSFLMTLNRQSFEALSAESKLAERFDKLEINPKKTALVNHALGVVYFYLNDRSEDKQDSDAFVEKTTDLLFRLTDTSTLMSMFDLGKFMVSRKKSVFSWD